MTLAPLRENVVQAACDLMGTIYIWGGKDPSGLDCSGFYGLSLFTGTGGAVDLRRTHNTDLLLRDLEPTTEAELLPGDAILYGRNQDNPKDADHVMMFLSPELCVGACGGTSKTTTPSIAVRMDARVKAKFFYRYRRPEILGYRRMPHPKE